ncbi:MAG: hypothetical protein J7604_26925 [Sporocytophaga sp.]|nr:hypothetical protein [Sporocytophaga sp.]
MDPQFNLHLREDRISSTWIVKSQQILEMLIRLKYLIRMVII